MRLISRALPLLITTGLVAGCANLAGLLTAQNLDAAKQLLKDAGVNISFKDPATGQTATISKQEDVKEIKSKDGKTTFQAGKDYEFRDGQLVMHNLQDKVDVSITTKDGKVIPWTFVPDQMGQKAAFIPDSTGAFSGPLAAGTDIDKAFADQLERDKGHRVTVTFPSSIAFKKDDAKALGFKPCPNCNPTLLPTHAWVSNADNQIAFDVQALGPKNPPTQPNGGQAVAEDLKQRLWILVVHPANAKFKVYKFKLNKDLDRADMPQPVNGQPVDPATAVLPAPQTVDVSLVVPDAATPPEYDDEVSVRSHENLQDAGVPQPAPNP